MLTDGDHGDDHRREHLRLLQRLGDRITAGDRCARLHDRVLNHAVTRRLGRDLETFEDADTRADERAERAGEARHRGFAEHVTEHRHLQQQAVDDELTVRRGVVLLEHVSAANGDGEEHPPVRFEEARRADDYAGRQRQCEAYRREHVLEDRDDEDKQGYYRDRRDAHDDRRIDHGALHLSHQGVVLFEERRQAH